MGIFSFLFGGDPVKEALRKGAVVIDLRSAYQYDLGRVPNSVNIPADRLAANIERIRQMKRPIIFCSAINAENIAAISLMKNNGIKNAYNGGSWEKVLKTMRTV